MVDLDMAWAGDLSTTPTGDLAAVTGYELGTERVLRRLVTNPGDYIWNPDYGAGLARYVGRPFDAPGIQALIRAQMVLERSVAAVPEPIIVTQSDVAGRLYVEIRYADAETAQSTALAINLPD